MTWASARRRSPSARSRPPTTPTASISTETGHSLCYKFRDYWLQNGGLDRFGYPITEFTIEDGRIVQYFQRGRMEWHPEKPEGQRILLAPLGSIYYKAAGLDPARLEPPPGGDSLGAVTSLRPRASVVAPVTVAKGTQTAFVFVTDQLGRPIGGAGVTLVVHYPERDQSYTLPPTGASGTSFPDLHRAQDFGRHDRVDGVHRHLCGHLRPDAHELHGLVLQSVVQSWRSPDNSLTESALVWTTHMCPNPPLHLIWPEARLV